MKFERVTVNPLAENCYIVWDEDTRQAAVIDCGANSEQEWEEIKSILSRNDLKVVYALQTHCHFDHTFGVNRLCTEFHLPLHFHPADHSILFAQANMASLFGFSYHGLSNDVPTANLQDEQELTLGNTVLKVIHTPGHTQGGVCFYCQSDGVLFSGDTLFCESVGRTDHPGGDMLQEVCSVQQKLFCLPDETIVFPGHGPQTTIAHEKQFNPFLR